jgi:hypothetical protein
MKKSVIGRAGAVVAAVIFWGGVANASLEFVVQEEPLLVSPEEEEVTIELAFTNTGGEPVRIMELESSCGCLEASTDRQVYAPGEKGLLSGIYTLGSLVGEVEKVIFVRFTRNGELETVRVPMTISVPEVMSIEPKVIKWELNGEATEQEFLVKILGETPIHLKNVESTRPQFEHKVIEVEAGREYRITIRPKDTSTVAMGALRLTTDSEIPKYQRAMAFFNVLKSR